MKLVRIVPFLDFGGVEKRVELTAAGFAENRDVKVTFVVLGKGGTVSNLLKVRGEDVRILDSDPSIPNFRLFFKLVKLLKHLRPDVIHTSGAEANFHGLLAGWLAGVQVRIGEEIGFPRHDWKWRLLFKITYSCAHCVIGISEAVKQKIVQLGEVPAKKVKVIYNPVDLKNREFDNNSNRNTEIESENKGPFVFITTCRLVAIKNLDQLMLAFSGLVREFEHKSLELWILGEGPLKESLIVQAGKLGIIDRVKFLGFQEDVFHFLKQADAFVLPSFSEGFSISLVEAMSMGLPCIATEVGGPAEIIQAGTGYLVDPNSQEDIKGTMRTVLALSASERKALGMRARQNIENRFSTDNYVLDLIRVYREFLQRK
jgi:glycosyltransferase involved in cell wall biosynthesis